ncbi:MAG: hypothetical protein JO316_24000 [Abitibacteriaceae bacterium]|nr:hypothetical protein [Abditibacteriaceae bacterium]
MVGCKTANAYWTNPTDSGAAFPNHYTAPISSITASDNDGSKHDNQGDSTSANPSFRSWSWQATGVFDFPTAINAYANYSVDALSGTISSNSNTSSANVDLQCHVVVAAHDFFVKDLSDTVVNGTKYPSSAAVTGSNTGTVSVSPAGSTMTVSVYVAASTHATAYANALGDSASATTSQANVQANYLSF